MERQKNEQAALDSTETTTPKMTPEEQERAGDAEAQRRNFPLAGLHYTKALNADPTRNSVRLKLGQMMLQQGMFDAAVTQFQDLLTREPNSAPAYQGIGQAYLQQGKLREAETALTKAITLDPSSWVSHNLMGLVYDQQQRYSDAIAAYKAALAIRPREPNVLNNLGLAYALSGDHETAIQFYEQAVRGRLQFTKAAKQSWAWLTPIASGMPMRWNRLKKRRTSRALTIISGWPCLVCGQSKVAAVCFEKGD